MANEGMPVPDNIEIEADGLISRLEDIFSKVSKAFRNNSTTHQNEAQQHALNNIKSKIMKKTFLMVAAVLAAVQSALPEASQDGKFSLDEVQLDALEKALADAKAEKEAQLTEINSLKQQLADAQKNLDAANAHIAELEQAPAEKNKQVIENGIKHEPAEKSELEQLSDTFARAARMYKGEE
jgi:septal ring factor EnvC (AmiA/AmiB activator)